MGDRANAVILDTYTDEAVFLYGHWSGYELPEIVRRALASEAGRNRWDDSAYLARIVFDTMSAGDQGSETGFGIATRPPDNEHDFIVLNCKEQRLYRVDPKRYDGNTFPPILSDSPSISFSDYVSAPGRDWDNLVAEVTVDA